jgi:hypothetical protein
MATDRIEYQAKLAHKNAKAKWGDGWRFLSREQREGAVALQIVALLVGQDEESASPGVRRLQRIAESAMGLVASPSEV